METVEPWEVDAPPGPAREPFLYLTHGANGDMSTPGLRAMSLALAESGHLTVRGNLPYRAAGRKSPPAAEKSVAGFIELFEQVRSRYGSGARWVTGGRSYGGRVASMAVADGLGVAGLIFFPYPLHKPGDPAHPRTEHWPRIQSPCLFIQGTKDPFCDIPVLETALPALGAKPTLLFVEGGDHSLKIGGDKRAGVAARSERSVVKDVIGRISDWLSDL